jgi:molybdopterin converting factor small subunit
MKIEVSMFAAAKEAVGRDRVVAESKGPLTSRMLLEELGRLHPQIQPLLPSCRLAVDDQYVADDFVVDDQCEVALIPPVSGG